MLKELIDFVDSVLPAVSTSTKEKVKDAISQFEKEGHQVKYLTLEPLPEVSQGDIISNIPFFYFDSDGKQKSFVSDALILSTSCHIDNKKLLVLVPVFPLDSFKGNEYELKHNRIMDYMYLPDGYLTDKYVNFEIMNSYSKELIVTGLSNGKLKRITSLNQVGYYVYIIKLTVYLMRREDDETLEKRNLGFCY